MNENIFTIVTMEKTYESLNLIRTFITTFIHLNMQLF